MLFQEIGKMYLFGKNYMDKEVNTDPGSRVCSCQNDIRSLL